MEKKRQKAMWVKYNQKAEKMMDNFLMTINSYFPLWEKSSVPLNILISVKSMA